MSGAYVPQAVRRLVATRADRLCEYCLISEEDCGYGCEVDHVISMKHGGLTVESNLAFACLYCNLYKGSDVGTRAPNTKRLIRFYNPRADRWSKHFQLARDGFTIVPLTPIGEGTARILGFNSKLRLEERRELRRQGKYPSIDAMARMI